MKSIKLLSVILLTVLFLSQQIYGENLKWYSYNEGSQIAKKEGKILLVDFYTDWCVWCKKMDADTYTNAKVAENLSKYFVLVKLNPEKDGAVTYQGQSYAAADFSKSAGVSGYPSLGFFTPNIEFITLVPGYMDASKFLKVLDYFIAKKYTSVNFRDYQAFTTLKEMSDKDPSNDELNFAVGYFYQSVMGDNKNAEIYYKKAVAKNPKFAEAYGGLAMIAEAKNDKASASSYTNEAKKNGGFQDADKMKNKVIEILRKYFKR